ncbi:MAG: hypothetical protein H7236_06325 [Gemmatimonadaceae bacterium]|uniref:hypothetical protein n=1 Tax=Caulobacter sp. DWP3-1-3b2 TaxID=2804643 RepID=UPI0019B29191|nr:hypothetical protein [Caulobacter sp.]
MTDTIKRGVTVDQKLKAHRYLAKLTPARADAVAEAAKDRLAKHPTSRDEAIDAAYADLSAR